MGKRTDPVASLDKTHSPELFSPIAHGYDLTNSILSFGLDRWWRRCLVRKAAPRPEERLLDLCTGTGAVVMAFARHEPQLAIVGIDLSPEMLTIGRAKLKKLDPPTQVVLQEGDALALPFADNTFDIVTIAFGLRNLPDHRRALREMGRVLRPGGRLLILEFSLPTAPIFSMIYRLYLQHWVPWLGSRLSGGRIEAYEYLARSIADFPLPARLVALMESEGFSPVKAFKLSGGITVLYRGERGA